MKWLIAPASSLLLVTSVVADARSDAFITALNDALRKNDRAAVGALVSYPLTVATSGITVPVRNAAEMTRMFDAVFTPALRCAIEQSAPGADGKPAARPGAVGADGLRFAGGVSARVVGGGYKVTGITVPRSAAGAAASAPQRVMFRSASVGQRTVTVSGRLGASQSSDTWLIALNKGEAADARIEGFAGASATVRFAAANGPAAPPLRPGLAPRSARIVASERTDYRIEVVRLASSCDPDVTYRMIVNVR